MHAGMPAFHVRLAFAWETFEPPDCSHRHYMWALPCRHRWRQYLFRPCYGCTVQVGVFADRGGKLAVVEYSELDPKLVSTNDHAGRRAGAPAYGLGYNAGCSMSVMDW